MKTFTRLMLIAAICGTAATISAVADVKPKLQPMSGTQYDGSDSATMRNPRVLYSYDSHGNETLQTTGSMTSMELEAHEYNYDKPYPVLLNNYYFFYDKAGYHDTIYVVKTTLDENGIRVGYEYAPTYDVYDNFKFDKEGHIVNLTLRGDTTDITWNGDDIASYSHSADAFGAYKVQLNNIETVYSMRPLNASNYEFDGLLNDFDAVGSFINAEGTYVNKNDYYGTNYSGKLTVTTKVSDDGKRYDQVALLNEKDTVSAQTLYLLDEYGSYRLVKSEPIVNEGMTTDKTATCNEFGDIISTKTITQYGKAYGNSTETSETYDPIDYDDNKPLRKMHYYRQAGTWNLGSVTVYDDWYEPTGISDAKQQAGEILGGAIYSIDGTKIRNLSAGEAATGRIEVAQKGLYIIKTNTANGVKTTKRVLGK